LNMQRSAEYTDTFLREAAWSASDGKVRETWVEANVEEMKTCSNARGHAGSYINSKRAATIHSQCFEASHRSGGLYVVGEGDVVDQAYSYDIVRIDQRIQMKVNMPSELQKRLAVIDLREKRVYSRRRPSLYPASGYLCVCNVQRLQILGPLRRVLAMSARVDRL
jgi:hypothetical protein